MRLTNWYPGYIKPVREGLYQQKAGGLLGYQYWNGKYWGCWSIDPEYAMTSFVKKSHSFFQNDPWRGVAK